MAFLAVIIIREYSFYFPGLDYFSKRQVVVCDDWVNTLAEPFFICLCNGGRQDDAEAYLTEYWKNE